MLLDALDNGFGFAAVRAAAAAVIDAGDPLQAHGDVVRDGRWKGDQLRVVVGHVAERDQAFVLATVVPLQAQAVHVGTQTFVQDALQVFDLAVVAGAVLFNRGFAEKAGGR
ncbi:hypothetical protein D3C71_1606880 [compost metagenome]